MALKEDEDFLRFLTMGAVGSAATARFLSQYHEHWIVELERYTMANKIWATKIKRLRLPDLLCLNCGLRIEARAKSTLEIKVSDSSTVGREWDAGLRDTDLIAFVYCKWSNDRAVPARQPACFTVADLRASIDASKLGPHKAASEGWERDRTWPARVATRPGQVLAVEPLCIRTRLDTGRKQSYRISGSQVFHYAKVGDHFEADTQFLMGTVAEPQNLTCPGQVWNYQADLEDSDILTRYTAVKATGLQRATQSRERLETITTDADARLALEACGSLARIEPDEWTGAVAAWARTPIEATANNIAAAMRMEAIFILSELKTVAAANELVRIAADTEMGSEARSAAVWGLGQHGASRPEFITPFLSDDDDQVVLHALVSLGSISEGQIHEVVPLLQGSSRHAATAATLLARQGDQGANALLDALDSSERGRQWALFALGCLPQHIVERNDRGRLDSSTRDILLPMWLGNSDNWLSQSKTSRLLDALDRQTIREDPALP